MNFKKWINEAKEFKGISVEDINWWARYAQSRIFNSEQEAREWIFRNRERFDRSAPFEIDGPEHNRKFAESMPLYLSGKSYKIGKRVRNDKRFRLKDLEVKLPDWEYIINTAQATDTRDFKVHKVQWIPIKYTVSDTNDYYLTNQLGRIQNLAYQIKTNGWIEAVIYDYKDKHIIEGQHRARAMRLLGFATVPGVGIEYL